VPLTVFTTYGIVTQTTGGRLPVAYVVTLIAMVFTALSYARMAVAYPVAGTISICFTWKWAQTGWFRAPTDAHTWGSP